MSEETSVMKAMAVMRLAFEADPDFARVWHDNIAMMCYDAILADKEMTAMGISHESALRTGNDAASRFMKLAFDAETRHDG